MYFHIGKENNSGWEEASLQTVFMNVMTLSLEKQELCILPMTHVRFLELLPYTGNRQSINVCLFLQYMCKLLANLLNAPKV